MGARGLSIKLGSLGDDLKSLWHRRISDWQAEVLPLAWQPGDKAVEETQRPNRLLIWTQPMARYYSSLKITPKISRQ